MSWQQPGGCGCLAESQLGCASPCSFPGAALCLLWQSPGRYSPGERVVGVKISLLSFSQRTRGVQALIPARANDCYAERCGKVTAQQTIKEFYFFE